MPGSKGSRSAPVRFSSEQKAFIVHFVRTTTSRTPWSDLARLLGLRYVGSAPHCSLRCAAGGEAPAQPLLLCVRSPKARFRVRDEWTEKLNPNLFLGPLTPEAKVVVWDQLILSSRYRCGPSGTAEWKRLKADFAAVARYPKTKLRNYFAQWKDHDASAPEYAAVRRDCVAGVPRVVGATPTASQAHPAHARHGRVPRFHGPSPPGSVPWQMSVALPPMPLAAGGAFGHAGLPCRLPLGNPATTSGWSGSWGELSPPSTSKWSGGALRHPSGALLNHSHFGTDAGTPKGSTHWRLATPLSESVFSSSPVHTKAHGAAAGAAPETASTGRSSCEPETFGIGEVECDRREAEGPPCASLGVPARAAVQGQLALEAAAVTCHRCCHEQPRAFEPRSGGSKRQREKPACAQPIAKRRAGL